MVERAQVRCPVCRSVVPAMSLRAVGDACPRCDRALRVVRQRPAPAGLLGKTLAVQATWSPAGAGRGRKGP
jgi:hypothetical protein